MKLTKDIIMQSKSTNGGWYKDQLKLINVTWPPQKNWINKVILQEFDPNIINAFINYKK